MDAAKIENLHTQGYKSPAQREYNLDDARLVKRCPLDNGRHDRLLQPKAKSKNAARVSSSSVGQLDRLPTELLLLILPHVDIPSLTRFRRVSIRAMQLVDAVPQYAAIYQHCPDVLRAIVSIKANAFSCDQLYQTLHTFRCSTQARPDPRCNRFGSYLYLLTGRRVCRTCYTTRREYEPYTVSQALSFFEETQPEKRKRRKRGLLEDEEEEEEEDTAPETVTLTPTRQLQDAKIPIVVSVPGQYCPSSWGKRSKYHARARLRLLDRTDFDTFWRSRGIGGPEPPDENSKLREARKYMAIVSAPYLLVLDSGRSADWGWFCLGCKGILSRNKFTTRGFAEHIATHGPVKRAGATGVQYVHVKRP